MMTMNENYLSTLTLGTSSAKNFGNLNQSLK